MPVFHSGRIYVEAGGDVWHGKRQVWLKSIDATQTGDVTGTGQVWSQPLEKHSMSTPSIHGSGNVCSSAPRAMPPKWYQSK